MQTFALKIASPRALHCDGPARFCRVETPDGGIGFEARHEPFLAALQSGSEVFYVDAEGRDHTLAVADGLLSFRENACTLVVTLP